MIFNQEMTDEAKAARAKTYLFDSQELAKKMLDAVQDGRAENAEITPVDKFATLMVTLALFGNNIAEAQEALLSSWNLLTELEKVGEDNG